MSSDSKVYPARLRGRDADHHVHHRPRCRGRDPEASREGQVEVTSQPTGCGSTPCRFVSPLSVAADCAGCACGGGSWVRQSILPDHTAVDGGVPSLSILEISTMGLT